MKRLIIKCIAELFTKVERLEERISSSNDTDLDDAFEWCTDLETAIKKLTARVEQLENTLISNK